MEITVIEIQKWLADFTTAIDANKEYLSELDSAIGDGDHGNNLARGMAAYTEAFIKQEPTTISDTFKVLSMALISKVGGASGPLYGSAFMNMTKASKEITTITSQAQLGEIIEAGLEGIKKRGKAEVGEKTMVDVWAPVVAALKEETFEVAVANEARDATKDIIATKGRASYLGERSIGHIDPGAASSALLFEILANYL